MSSGSQTNMLRWRQKATPTQAQIEAAHQIRVWLGRNATAETNPEKKAAFIEAHNVALKIEEAALTTAAEAGEQNDPLIGFTQFDLDKEIKRIEAATIERCAQVVDDKLTALGYIGLAATVTAAIRALGQAPHSFEDNPLDWRRP